MTRRAKARGNGEGSVFRSGDRWVAQVSVLDEATGKRRRLTRKAATRSEAVALLDDLRKQKRSGVIVGGRMTVAAWLERWLAVFVVGQKAPATVEWYGSMVRLHLIPAIGAVKVADLRPSHIARMHQAIAAKGLAASTVKGAHAVLRTALTQAEREGLVSRNVARLQPPPSRQTAEVQPPSGTQVRQVLDASRGTRDHALYAVLATAGLRLGEALALRWDDLVIDSDEPTVTIARKVARRGGRLIVDEPKTRASAARVPLTRLAVDALTEHRRLQAADRLAAPSWEDPGLVFPTTTGTQQEPRSAQRRWERLRSDLGMAGTRLHDLRHACASLLLEAGTPLKVVQKVLRHSRLATTADLYTHVTEQLERDAGGPDGRGARLRSLDVVAELLPASKMALAHWWLTGVANQGLGDELGAEPREQRNPRPG